MAAAESAIRSARAELYPRYLLALLFVTYVCNYVDRQILSILMESIRIDMELSDTQLGFLTGFTFAIFYAVLGIPIARLADRGSRRRVLAVSLALWSVMTAASGMAQSYVQLLLARIGVAVGEAGGSPPAHSLISDHFGPGRRATALAVYSMGIPVGVLVGLAAGGWVNEAFDWRTAFFVVGAPGVLLALLVLTTVREPARAVQGRADVSTLEVLRYLGRLRSFRHLSMASALHAFAGYGVLQWNPTFLIRTHGMGTAEIGLYLGLIIGVSGVLGTLAGGLLADRLSGRDQRWYVWLPGIAMTVSVPFYLGIYLAPTAWAALAFFAIPTFLANSFTGPAFATVQSLAPPRMRSVAAAVFLFLINIVGLGLGPQAVGVLSDALRPAFAEDSLRWALSLVVLAKGWAAVHYWLASRPLREELARVPA